MTFVYGPSGREVPFVQKIKEINWFLVVAVTAIAVIGFAMLYSTATPPLGPDGQPQGRGSFDPWASRQMARYCFGLVAMLAIGFVDIRLWMQLAYPAYAVALLLLIAVELVGVTGMGAQRWVEIPGIGMRLQPSEVMKVTMVLALARYVHGLRFGEISTLKGLAPALLLIILPVLLVLKQPDLGTSLLLIAGGMILLFLAGLSWRIVGGVGVLGIISAGIGWQFFLQEYQKQRVLTFLNPESDPLGAGYHILQAKIAMGSGGTFGKGYLKGTQSQLNFLPEKHTDFIFTMLSEELGLTGGVFLLVLYLIVMARGMTIALSSRNHFGRLVAMGVMATFLLYIVINTAMVMGLIPVVGVPLPLVSYGGTAMMTIMFGLGLVMSVHIHRDIDIPRQSAAFW
jgi:rod shape determining protein RodA